ncbi:MAG: branched-chain amino acid ABC transporter permease [Erysipelotrichaceae bacterium]
MTQFLQQLINGLSLGSIYALIALGYTMVYGIIRLINFAHGDIYMIGAYVAFLTTTYLQFNFVAAFITSMVVSSIIGVLIERIAYKPLRNATRIAVLITAIGVSFFLEYGTMKLMGAEVKTFPPLVQNTVYRWNGLVVTSQQLLIFGISFGLMILLTFIVKKTKMGKAMRAVSVDADAAKLMGIDVDRTISYTFAIGSALAGAAGVLVGVYYNSISPLMGMVPGLKAFVAAVFGGIGIIPGAMVGGLSIGLIETLVSGYGGSLIKDGVVYAILIVILILRPAGLLGKHHKEKV